jgi:ATP-dependent RNA helicase RhlB
VEQVLYHAGRHEKFGLLLGLLRAEEGARVLIFTNTREEARRLVERLERNGHLARALTGDVDQRHRLRTLQAFKDGTVPILVATDVASRGLHIPDVSHVYNWDLPQDAEDYVHRIGRTARAGAAGKAISLVDEASAFSLDAVERFIGQKIEVRWAPDDLFLPEIKPTAEERRRFAAEREARREAREGRGGRGGHAERGRPRPSRGPRRAESPPPAPAPPPPAPAPPGAPATAPRRRRRRRSRRRGPAGEAGGSPAPPTD